LKKIGKLMDGILTYAMSIALALMAILVFGNVVLRYVFNSGITWSEEMSRFLFIWMTFLGAIGALKDNEHLGVDLFVKRLSTGAKYVVFTISNLVMFYALWLVLDGSIKMTILNVNSKAPATGMPLSYISGTGIVMSVAMAIILIYQLYQALFVKGAIDQLTKTKESEEEILVEADYSNQQQATGGGR